MALVVAVQPFASVMVTECVLAGTLLNVAVVVPLSHAYVIGDVPPAGVAVMLPLLEPQVALVAVALTVGGGALVIVDVNVKVQLFASVMVTVYEPAASPVKL